MYIKKIVIENIRSVQKLEMEFPKPAGWHVLIGDNGSGKTSIARAIGLCLVGPGEGGAARVPFNTWLRKNGRIGHCRLDFTRDEKYDGEEESKFDLDRLYSSFSILLFDNMQLKTEGTVQDLTSVPALLFSLTDEKAVQSVAEPQQTPKLTNIYENWGKNGWFSAGFGPFRRFTGGNAETERLFKSHPRLGAHLSLFGEDIALSEALEWIKELDYLRLKEQEAGSAGDSAFTFKQIIRFVNESHLLPHNMRIDGIDKDGIKFIDGNGSKIDTLELSDGFRSILSLTFELIRQLVRVYGAREVFKDIEKGNMFISLPGVVVIDEIDAHLHPSWQTAIGEWFTQYFPELQFIVTTHSPLVCRAARKGSIWKLAAPGSEEASGEVTGLDKERLIDGNILDAYATDLFGESPTRSAQSQEKLERLGRLNILSALGKITDTEEQERIELQQILSTDASTAG
jgi:hypothetical protein